MKPILDVILYNIYNYRSTFRQIHDLSEAAAMPSIIISESVADGFRSFAVPLEDTWESILKSALEFIAEHDVEFRIFRGQSVATQTDDAQIKAEDTEHPNPGPQGPTVEELARMSEDSIEEAHVARMSPTARSLYEKVRRIALAIGSDVQTGAVTSYLRFSTNGAMFATLTAQKNALAVYIRPEATDLQLGGEAEMFGIHIKRPNQKNWTLDAGFKVSPSTNLDGVAELFRRSYEVVK